MRLFVHCLLRANFKDNNWRGITIKRGSFLTSIDTLSKETKLSISQIRTSIKKLKSTGEIASSSHARHSVITIVKYDSYQSVDKLDDIDVTLKSQRNDIEIATNKNVKKEKKVKKENIYTAKFSFEQTLIDLGADKKTLSDWMKVRKDKKASNTETALKSFINKVNKSNYTLNEVIKICAEESWKGFEESWIKKSVNQTNEYSPITAKNIETAKEWINE
jgi:hypothetical protein